MSTSTLNESEAMIVSVDPTPLLHFEPIPFHFRPSRIADRRHPQRPARRSAAPSGWDLHPAPTHAARRALDMVASAAILTACMPLIAMIALLIKLDSPGPVFFLQERVGLSGRLFKMIKFRTMHVNATELISQLPEHLQRELKIIGSLKDDPRITRVGKWVRKFSLDELPQLINVLRGDMSLIGPRPYLASQLNAKSISRSVLRVRPGMTGLWQVSGRNQLTLRRRISIDLRYVAKRGFWLDLSILLRTPWVVLMKSEQAY